MWTNENRTRANRDKTSYPNNLMGEERVLFENLIPPVQWSDAHSAADLLKIVNGLM